METQLTQKKSLSGKKLKENTFATPTKGQHVHNLTKRVFLGYGKAFGMECGGMVKLYQLTDKRNVEGS